MAISAYPVLLYTWIRTPPACPARASSSLYIRVMPPTLTHGFNEVESIIAKTMEYLSIPSVVGFERVFLNFLYDDFHNLGLSVIKYHGLLEVRGNDPHSAIVCAHIDRHGLVSLGKKEFAYAAQYVREIKYGEEHRSSRKELEEIAERFEGERLFAYDPKTGMPLGEGLITASKKAISNGDSIFFVDGIEDMEAGTPLAYARMARAEDGHLKGQIDNTISIGVVYALFRAGFQGTAYLTTEEEVGKSWTHIAAHLEREEIETEELLVIDTSPYLDHSPMKEGTLVFRHRDRFAEFNKGLTQKLVKRCEEMGCPYQIKDEDLLAAGKEIDDLGSTELGRLVLERKRQWAGTTVQIPTTMYHTSNETTTKKAIRNYFRFLKNILVEEPLALDIKVKETSGA